MKTVIRTATIGNTVTGTKFAKEYKIENQPESWEELEELFGGFAPAFEKALNYFDFHGTRDHARRAIVSQLNDAQDAGNLDWSDDENVKTLLEDFKVSVEHGPSPSKADRTIGKTLSGLIKNDKSLIKRCNSQAEKFGMRIPEAWDSDTCAKLKMNSRLWKRRQTADPLADF